jgi:hypothetical protein
MKKVIAITLVVVFAVFCENVLADDTVANVQAGMGLLGGMLNKSSKSKANEQQSTQENKDIQSDTQSTKKFQCQFGDFAWGINMQAAQNILKQKGIAYKVLESDVLGYTDKLSGLQSKISLTFLKDQLVQVFIQFVNDGSSGDVESCLNAISSTLHKKYGDHHTTTQGWWAWGGRGADGLGEGNDSIEFDGSAGGLSYQSANYQSLAMQVGEEERIKLEKSAASSGF